MVKNFFRMKEDTAEEMVEFGCLETKILKFCKDSEYQADMSTSKTSKDRKRFFNQSLKIPSKPKF